MFCELHAVTIVRGVGQCAAIVKRDMELVKFYDEAYLKKLLPDVQEGGRVEGVSKRWGRKGIKSVKHHVSPSNSINRWNLRWL